MGYRRDDEGLRLRIVELEGELSDARASVARLHGEGASEVPRGGGVDWLTGVPKQLYLERELPPSGRMARCGLSHGMPSARRRLAFLEGLHAELDQCRACEGMIGPVVHGPALLSPIMLVGQAPGPREGSFGKPFAWTAGRTLFRWFEEALGVSEEVFRARVYMAAVARCFPGKASGGGDRKPNADEIAACRRYLAAEASLIEPDLVLAVGTLAIGEILGGGARRMRLDQIVGQVERCRWHGREVDVIALPHPSGASPWHKIEPGKALLARALAQVARHPAADAAFGDLRIPPR